MDTQARALLEAPNFCHVSTLRKDGTPYSVLVWVGVDGDRVVLNTEQSRAWRRHVERDPRVSLLVADKENPYSYVRIDGRVVADDDGREAMEHIDQLAQKYLGEEKYPMHQEGDVRVKLWVEPEKVAVQGG